MDSITQALKDLRAERARIDEAIATLEKLAGRGVPAAPADTAGNDVVDEWEDAMRAAAKSGRLAPAPKPVHRKAKIKAKAKIRQYTKHKVPCKGPELAKIEGWDVPPEHTPHFFSVYRPETGRALRCKACRRAHSIWSLRELDKARGKLAKRERERGVILVEGARK